MTFYLIGLGLDLNSISCNAKEILKKCDKIYLEGYTVDFPYKIESLKKELDVNLEILERKLVEDEHLLKEAKTQNIALLVYGDSLSATTHTQLIIGCKKKEIDYQIFHNTSILISIAQTGLQLYKFGKISSMPKWQKSYQPTSFLDYVIENQKINAHSLILIDIGLKFNDSLTQLKEACKLKDFNLEKTIVINNSGLKTQKIYYDSIENLEKINNIQPPFCLIIPSKMHFLEQEALKFSSE